MSSVSRSSSSGGMAEPADTLSRRLATRFGCRSSSVDQLGSSMASLTRKAPAAFFKRLGQRVDLLHACCTCRTMPGRSRSRRSASSSGWAQWVPARTATPRGRSPSRRHGHARPSSRRTMIAPLPGASPKMRSEFMRASRSMRVVAQRLLVGGDPLAAEPSCSRAPRRARSPATIGGVPASKRCGGSL